MINLQKCLICSTDKDLNTTLSLKLDDSTTVSVVVCDVHAEDLTVKIAKEKYLEKKAVIDRIMQEARDNGLEISIPTTSTGLVLAKSTAVEQPATRQQALTPQPIDKQQVDDEINLLRSGKLIKGSVARQKLGKAQSVGGSFDRLTTVDRQEELSRSALTERAETGQEQIRIGLVEGRGNQPIAIPTVIKDDFGTTVIRVSQGMTDDKLQKQFKGLADSKDANGLNTHCFGADGYALTDCQFCKGKGSVITVSSGQKVSADCPRCKGAGLMPRQV